MEVGNDFKNATHGFLCVNSMASPVKENHLRKNH